MTLSYTFRNGRPVINAGGEPRMLGALAPESFASVPRFTDMHPQPDPASWQECDWSTAVSVPIRNQGQGGSCAGFAGWAALTYSWKLAGQDAPLLSGTFPYGLVNGGVDAGTSVTSVLKVLQQIGTCTNDEVNESMLFQNQFPQSAWDTAKKYRSDEYLLCTSFEEICEAVNKGFPVAFGIRVGQSIYQTGPDGICPITDAIIGGHAMCAIGLKRSRTNTWLLKVQNSWSARWGLKGFGFLTRGHFDNYVDAYAITNVVLDDSHPPVVKVSVPEPSVEADEALAAQPAKLRAMMDNTTNEKAVGTTLTDIAKTEPVSNEFLLEQMSKLQLITGAKIKEETPVEPLKIEPIIPGHSLTEAIKDEPKIEEPKPAVKEDFLKALEERTKEPEPMTGKKPPKKKR